ncbi:MAG TPA: UDP-N-acetylmuramoyl-L-alanyl-D-glutamate--2,6-diaminopimelate ligase [Thermoanaerobaculia bacterium]|nr:UDP-N-acetylmuramoyl-L-alanyl-D-glutamate--2,6-diaminopimelate ligase [Thermoanaerobaculia bacterium]
MKLVELLSVLPDSSFPSSANDLEITGISADSREVRPGELFVAVRGEKVDGWERADEAARRGAAAIVSDREAPARASVPWVRVSSARRALALLSTRFAGDPAEKLVLAGVTGTNGKTTTAMLLESLLARRYGRAGFIGTVAYRTGRRELPSPHTTPEAPVLQQLLAEMVESGTPAAAMEVSSHGLALDRVEGCRFDVAVFTNLTREHLDFHGDLENYYSAKKRLFELRKPGAAAVVNVDDPAGRRLAGEVAPPVLTWSPSGAPADVRADEVHCDLSGTSLAVLHGSGRFRIASPLIGRFNVDNLLGAAAAGLALGVGESDVAAGCAAVTRVPGRLERVEAGQPYAILVDYAHTEDALERLLEAVRGLTDKKIVLVFGCGGDRDPGKRAPMGRIAGSLADIAIATSDNPRSEDPEAILAQVEKGLAASGATKYLKVTDRRNAIRTAIELANPGTVVVIAGRGHERVQVIGDQTVPFDDREVAAEYASRR